MASILHLSNETLRMITKEVSASSRCHESLLPETFSLRQSCLRLRDFATPLIFNTLHVVIEEKRLRNLVEISESSRLAEHVKRLEIHTLHLLPYNDFRELEASFNLNEEYPMRRFGCGSSDLSESEYTLYTSL